MWRVRCIPHDVPTQHSKYLASRSQAGLVLSHAPFEQLIWAAEKKGDMRFAVQVGM